MRLRKLESALYSKKYTSGCTHNFYLYPARFSPEIAHIIIKMFSKPGDWVLDPFMGGGTAIIEGLTLGRSVIGIDLNALAHFVANVRTRPLSPHDEDVIRRWANTASNGYRNFRSEALPPVENFPLAVK